jgi:hypothetical protein
MPRFLVKYTHVEETTYEQWVDAADQMEALQKIEGEETFENVVNIQGLELKDYEVVEEQEEEY